MLDLSRNKLGARGGKIVGDVLKVIWSLEELNIAGNGCGSKGCAAIFSSLSYHDTIRCIDASRMDIVSCGDTTDAVRSLEAVFTLADHVAKSKVMSELLLSECNLVVLPKHKPINKKREARIAFEGVARIIDAATTSDTMRFIDLRGNNVGGRLKLYPAGKHLCERILEFGADARVEKERP